MHRWVFPSVEIYAEVQVSGNGLKFLHISEYDLLLFINSDAEIIRLWLYLCSEQLDYQVEYINTLRPRQMDKFRSVILKRIFFNENVWISIKISLKFVPKGPINTISALVQMMAWRRPGDKPLSEPMIVS